MRVLVLYCHPVAESFNAAVHVATLAGLTKAGHHVDDCDLYAEKFDPVMSRAERLAYHTISDNRLPVAPYVERLLAAEGLVIVTPVWNYGFPAMLKGFVDRVFLPGVSFEMMEGVVRPRLHNVRRLTALMTYGGTRSRAFLAGDPPRKIVTRVMRAAIKPAAPVRLVAHYDMNRSTDATRGAFLRRVEREMALF